MEDEKKQENVDTHATTDNAQKKQKTENKNEGEKVRKSVAQKGENGEIIFKNQDELDGFIARKYAQASEKAQKGETSKQVQENQHQDESQQQEQQQIVSNESLLTEIALAMTEADVIPKKARRAAKLIDLSKVVVNGAIDPTKLQEEINSVVAEFPELKTTKEEEKEEKGFKFGATQSDEKAKETTKSVPAKRWNRFKSI